jgi:hypothetical protein
MFKRAILFLMMAASTVAFSQDKSSLPDNRELVTKAKSLYLHSNTFFMKREQLESSLLGRKEFKSWDLQITSRKDLADLLVIVRRIPFTNNFTYTVTDRATETVVMAGQVNSLAGTVHGLIAGEIVDKMKRFRDAPQPAAQAPPPPQPK